MRCLCVYRASICISISFLVLCGYVADSFRIAPAQLHKSLKPGRLNFSHRCSNCDNEDFELKSVNSQEYFRRQLLRTARRALPVAAIVAFNCITSTAASAEDTVTDAVDQIAVAKFAAEVQAARKLCTDELIIEFTGESLGLKLMETMYKGFPVVTVKEIKDADLQTAHPELEIGAIVVGVNGSGTDGLPLNKIVEMVNKATRPLQIKFRDPSRFFKQLDSTLGPPRRVVSTSYLPANTRDAGAPEQLIIVERLAMPPPEMRVRASQLLDVLEIQYVAQVQSDGEGKIVDSSAERAAPGTSSKSIYYVLGQQNGPPGRFPPGWDLTLRGMVAGEKRRITLPSSLAYDRKGDKYLGIPPFATMVYTVKLLSIT